MVAGRIRLVLPILSANEVKLTRLRGACLPLACVGDSDDAPSVGSASSRNSRPLRCGAAWSRQRSTVIAAPLQ